MPAYIRILSLFFLNFIFIETTRAQDIRHAHTSTYQSNNTLKILGGPFQTNRNVEEIYQSYNVTLKSNVYDNYRIRKWFQDQQYHLIISYHQTIGMTINSQLLYAAISYGRLGRSDIANDILLFLQEDQRKEKDQQATTDCSARVIQAGERGKNIRFDGNEVSSDGHVYSPTDRGSAYDLDNRTEHEKQFKSFCLGLDVNLLIKNGIYETRNSLSKSKINYFPDYSDRPADRKHISDVMMKYYGFSPSEQGAREFCSYMEIPAEIDCFSVIAKLYHETDVLR